MVPWFLPTNYDTEQPSRTTARWWLHGAAYIRIYTDPFSFLSLGFLLYRLLYLYVGDRGYTALYKL